MQFDLPKEKSSIIKVIGVGGGGSNAVNHMFKQGIKDVDFIVCNTDRQVLDSSPVPLKIQLGAALTEGLGAGSLPEMGMKAALENEQELRNALAKTKMLFITAGMGGGTGTGAAPVIAKIAREMGILTVSICTLPFSWEGKLRKRQAEEGLAELKKYSDSVLVILNDKIREIYHNLKVGEAFAHADNVLTSAAKCIAELINVALTINVDFNDVRRVMENSGVAIMGSAMASGEGRALKAVTQALNSPLLNDNDIRGARYVLVSITCGAGKDELTMDELAEITEYVQEAAGQTAEMIKGFGTNDSLGDKVSITIIASGFERKNADLGLASSLPDMKMIHLDEKVAPSLKGEDKDNSTLQGGGLVEISKMTEPMLKSEVIADAPTLKGEKQSFNLEENSVEIHIELKKAEEKVAPKHIEVMLPPVVSEKKIEPIVEEIIEEAKIEILSEVIPGAEPAAEAKEEPVLPIAATPVISEVPAVMGDAVSENKVEEDEFPAPFIIIKQEEQKSIEFDLTEEKAAPFLNGTDKDNNSLSQSNSSGAGEAQTKEELPAFHPVEPESYSNRVNMDVKRTSISSSMNIEKTVMPDASSNQNKSKVTQIAEVTLNSQPPLSDAEAKQKAQEKIQKLRELSFKVKTPGGLAELENEPAYKRKNVVLNDAPHSSESEISRLTLGMESSKEGTGIAPSLRPDNSFLHDKPD